MIAQSIRPKVLIPAAGFGKRAGSPEAKEMLPHPRTGKPLIESALRAVHDRGWEPVVIVRKEKRELIEFVGRFSSSAVVVIEPSREWPGTLLAAESYWGEHNILILPDTEFEPLEVLDQLAARLAGGAEIAAAIFETDRPDSWGMLRHSAPDEIEFCEKPQSAKPGDRAWGLLGFHKNRGRELFSHLLASCFDHEWKKIAARADTVRLDRFRDHTRGTL